MATNGQAANSINFSSTMPLSTSDVTLSSFQQQTALKDTTFTKIFVGGLPYHTTDESLRVFFSQFGNTDEAVVILDRQTGKSKGYGFVTMDTKEAAENAILDPNPIIDGRKANVNLAYLGAKTRLQSAAAMLATPTANIFPFATALRYPTAAPTLTSTALTATNYGLQPFTFYPQLTTSTLAAALPLQQPQQQQQQQQQTLLTVAAASTPSQQQQQSFNINYAAAGLQQGNATKSNILLAQQQAALVQQPNGHTYLTQNDVNLLTALGAVNPRSNSPFATNSMDLATLINNQYLSNGYGNAAFFTPAAASGAPISGTQYTSPSLLNSTTNPYGLFALQQQLSTTTTAPAPSVATITNSNSQ